MNMRSKNIIQTKLPKNQHSLVLYYLLNYTGFSLKDVINDSMFFKFQTRLSEIENEIGYKIAKRVKKKFINRFKRKSKFNLYFLSLKDNEANELFKKYNNE